MYYGDVTNDENNSTDVYGSPLATPSSSFPPESQNEGFVSDNVGFQPPTQTEPAGVSVENPQVTDNTDTVVSINDQEAPAQPVKKNGFRVVLVFLIFVFILSGLAYASYTLFIKDKYLQKPADEDAAGQLSTESVVVDTSNWFTYLNAVYGFTFNYPQDWTTRTIDATGEYKEATINSETFDLFKAASEEKYPEGFATFQILSEKPVYDENWDASIESVGGSVVDKYTSSVNEGLLMSAYVIELFDGKYLEIIFRYFTGTEDEAVFRGIINSFSLINYEEDESLEEDEFDSDFDDGFYEDF